MRLEGGRKRGFKKLRDGKEGRKWKLPDLLYADDLVLCDELEEDLRRMMGWFIEV